MPYCVLEIPNRQSRTVIGVFLHRLIGKCFQNVEISSVIGLELVGERPITCSILRATQHNLRIRLQSGKRVDRTVLTRIRTEVDQIRKLIGSKTESNIREQFFRLGNDTMVRQYRVGDHRYVALRHVTTDAVVRRSFSLSDDQRNGAAFLSMANEALLAE